MFHYQVTVDFRFKGNLVAFAWKVMAKNAQDAKQKVFDTVVLEDGYSWDGCSAIIA